MAATSFQDDTLDYSILDDDSSDISELSSAPASPSPPPGFDFYPSPPASNETQDSCATRGQDDAPPASKRRRVSPKERKTEHLDLSDSATLSYSEQQAQIDLLQKTIRRHRKIVVIAGAGISTSAGSTCASRAASMALRPSLPSSARKILLLPRPFKLNFLTCTIVPDFRSADGLFKSLQKKHNLKASGKLLFDAAVYQDESLTASFHELVRSLSEEAAKTNPTAFHHMLARLGQENRLTRLYTQNIDGIETSMPPLASQVPLNPKAPWPRTIQLHGSLEKMVCQKCCHMTDFQGELFDGPDAPLCPACSETDAFRATAGQRSHGVGKMRPRIVLYNEHNPDEEAIASVMNADVRSRPDALIVVGTSLKIPGVRCLVRNLCRVIRSRRNGVTMWINNEPPVGKEFEDCWDLVVKGDCEEVARLADLKRWNDNSEGVFDECNPEEVERVKKEQGSLSVVIQTPKKKQKTSTGFLTPSSSNGEDQQQSELPHKGPLPSNGACPNPASRGRSLKEALKASQRKKDEPKKTSRKKPTSKKKASEKKEDAAKGLKITTFGKVTKVTVGLEKATAKLEKDPMHPLPPGAARNNGPTFPNLVTQGDDASCDELWSKTDTICPKSVPRGMRDLLNPPTA